MLVQIPIVFVLLGWQKLIKDVQSFYPQQQRLLVPLKRKKPASLKPTNYNLFTHRKNIYRINCPWQPSSILLETSRKNSINDVATDISTNNDAAIQWELFGRYHALKTKSQKEDGHDNDCQTTTTSWKGLWTTYDYIGDVQFENFASVNYIRSRTTDSNNNNLNEEDEGGNSEDTETKTTIQQTHTIVIGATQSDCTKCFDSFETRDLPVASYKYGDLKKSRLGSCGMVNGPTLLRNGIMATELVLSYQDTRVRVVFQHAPVWEKNVEPGSCPPQGLKVYRTILSREANRDIPPTAEYEREIQQQLQVQTQTQTQTQTQNDNSNNDVSATSSTENESDSKKENVVLLYRPVPPYSWHKKWSGTSWTWGEQAGNRGWKIDELDDDDSWHGSNPTELWNLRLVQGGIFVSCPRVVTSNSDGSSTNPAFGDRFRLAWLPNDDTLLRLEVGIVAFKPIYDDELMVGFEPPSLASYRCDVLINGGDLEGQPSFVETSRQQELQQNDDTTTSSTDQWQ